MNSLEYNGFNDQNASTDEELDELFEKFCDYVSAGLKPKNNDVSVLNPDGMRKFAMVYNALQATSKGSNAKITYGINEPFIGSGFIRIEGKKIIFKNTEIFAKAAKIASNFEVYPLTNGNVRMAFTFDGLSLR